MNKALMLATVFFFGVAGQVAAKGDVCPTRDKDEGGKAYSDRTHDYCEVRWSDLVAAKQTGGQTHDRFINVCSRKCAGALGARTAGSGLASMAGSQIAPLGYAVAAAGISGVIAGAVGTSASGGSPSSP